MNLLREVLTAVVPFAVLWLFYLIGLVGSLGLSRYVDSRLDKLAEDKSTEIKRKQKEEENEQQLSC